MPALTTEARLLLGALLGLGSLHLIMWVALCATRIPAMIIKRIPSYKATGEAMASLPTWATNVADNYNHLAEAPTVFYAISLAVVLLGQSDGVNVIAAWAYVGLRVLHSAIQATKNIILLRFFLFSLSWLVLGFLLMRAAARLIFSF